MRRRILFLLALYVVSMMLLVACYAATVRSTSGHTAHVSEVFAPHIQCFIHKLDAAGFQIKDMTGYAKRGNASAHPTGNAIDINQCGFGYLCRYGQRHATPFPHGYGAMASSCGVFNGAAFGDYGHFEMPGKYGYVNLGRTRHARTHDRAGRAAARDGTGSSVQATGSPSSPNFH